MIPILFHIYGPFFIYSYGTAIALGLFISVFLLLGEIKKKRVISKDDFYGALFVIVFLGIIGCRFFYCIIDKRCSLVEFFSMWEGGGSLLGGLVFILLFLPIYLLKLNIPVLKFLDIISIYSPLFLSISRLGCFCAGCCYGVRTDSCLGVTYAHPASLAPLFIKIHPTQLYSSFLLFFIFILMKFVFSKLCSKPGQLFSISILFLISERFIVDFWRADRILYNSYLSIYQLISIFLFFIFLMLLILFSFKK